MTNSHLFPEILDAFLSGFLCVYNDGIHVFSKDFGNCQGIPMVEIILHQLCKRYAKWFLYKKKDMHAYTTVVCHNHSLTYYPRFCSSIAPLTPLKVAFQRKPKQWKGFSQPKLANAKTIFLENINKPFLCRISHCLINCKLIKTKLKCLHLLFVLWFTVVHQSPVDPREEPLHAI